MKRVFWLIAAVLSLAWISCPESPAATSTVISVTVSPSTAIIGKGGKKIFTAAVEGTNDYSTDVTWSVIGGSSSSISASGELTVAAGETSQTLVVRATSAQDSKKSGTASVTVTAASASTVTSVIVSPSTVTLEKGARKTFTASVAGTNNPSTAVTWSVTPASGGSTISAAGELTVAAGEISQKLTVKATSVQDGNKSGTASVTVVPAGDPMYRIQSDIDGLTANYLIDDGSGILKVGAGTADSSIWVVETYGGNKALKNKATGKYINVKGLTPAWNDAANAKLSSYEANAAFYWVFNVSTVGNITNNGAWLSHESEHVNAPVQSGTVQWRNDNGTEIYESSNWKFTSYAADTTPRVTGVSVSPSIDTLAKGAKRTFTANVSVEYGASTAVTWSVTPTNGGSSISSGGELTVGASEGAASLTVKATSTFDITKSGTATVYIGTPPPSTSKQRFPGYGADVPFRLYEAEDASYSGSLLTGKDYKTEAGEASGKKAVRLSSSNQYVEFTLAESANALVLRYSMPDNDGNGTTGKLAVYANGTKIKDLDTTSKYAAVYGKYPFENNPAAKDDYGRGRIRYYDEGRLLLGASYNAGTKIKIQKEDSAAWYVIDFAEFESVPAAIAQPANSLSITDYGAVGNGTTDCRSALTNAITAAKSQGRTVWIPSGDFYISQNGGSPTLNANGVTIAGAGIWYSTLVGYPYFMVSGNNNYFHDFSIFGSVRRRADGDRHCAIEIDAGGSGGRYENLWFEHVKCGFWISKVTGTTSVKNCRIRNTYADGINIAQSSKGVTVENCDLRNHGDDAIAINSENGHHNTDNVIKNNTAGLTYHASCFAVYGGGNNTVQGNAAYDTIGFGSGINISSRFGPQGFAGTTAIKENLCIRTGSLARETEWNKNNGGIWLVAWDLELGGTIQFANNRITDSLYDGITIDGSRAINGTVTFDNITIENPGGYGVYVHGTSVSGSAKFTNVKVTGGTGAMHNARGSAFTLTNGGGNSW